MRPAPVRLAVLLPVLAASVACLCAAFVTAGAWIGACAVPLPAVLLLFHVRIRRGWAGPVFLVGLVAAAAAAALTGAPAYLAVPGAALALAAWDLADFQRFVRAGASTRPDSTLERRHLASLSRAIALGLLPAAGAAALSLRLPFAVMFLLVILDLGCLAFALRLARKEP